MATVTPNSPLLMTVYSPFDVDMGSSDFDWDGFSVRLDSGSSQIKNLVFAIETAVFLKNEIAAKFNFLEDQAKELSRIVRDTLVGEVPLTELSVNISSRLQLDPQTARDIANQLVSQLFAPVMSELQELQRQKFGTMAATSQQNPAEHSIIEPGDNVLDLRNQ